MKSYLVSYDLKKNRNYQKLYDALDVMGAKRILESTWFFKERNTNSDYLRDYFKTVIDSDDVLIVSEATDLSVFNVEV